MNKSKKTPILLVIALIICMGLTAGLTMAFFGGTSTGSSTVTLKTGVKVGATATASNDGAMVVPGQPIDISATGTVEPYSSTGTVVPALLRLKFTIGGAMDVTPTLNTTDAMTIKTQAGDATGYWVLNESDGYYYLCAEAAEATVANTQLLKFTPVNTTTEEDKTKVSLTGNFVVPTSLGNEASNQSLDINARFEVIQAEIYANGSDTAIADENLTIGNEAVQEVFGEFAPVEQDPYLSLYENGVEVEKYEFEDGAVTMQLTVSPEIDETSSTAAYYIPMSLENNVNINFLQVDLTNNTDIMMSYILNGLFEENANAMTNESLASSLATVTQGPGSMSGYLTDFTIGVLTQLTDGTAEDLTINVTFSLLNPTINKISYADLLSDYNSNGTGIQTKATSPLVAYDANEQTYYQMYYLNITDVTEESALEISFNKDDVLAVIDGENLTLSQLSNGGYMAKGIHATADSLMYSMYGIINGPGFMFSTSEGTSSLILPIYPNQENMVTFALVIDGEVSEDILQQINEAEITITTNMTKKVKRVTPSLGESILTVTSTPVFQEGADSVYTIIFDTSEYRGKNIFIDLSNISNSDQLKSSQFYSIDFCSFEAHINNLQGMASMIHYTALMVGRNESDNAMATINSDTHTLLLYYNHVEGITDQPVTFNIPIKIADQEVTEIDFASINNTESVDLTFDTPYLIETQNLIYNFTIKNITENCTIEVSFESEYEGHGWYGAKVGSGHNLSASMATYELTQTFTLTQGEDFDFCFAQYSESFDGPKFVYPITLTFKVVSA